jgi:hypothetical protein
VVAHIGDGLEPAGEECRERVGVFRDQIVARVNDRDMEILDAVAEFDQDVSASRLDEFIDGDAVCGDAVDLMGF